MPVIILDEQMREAISSYFTWFLTWILIAFSISWNWNSKKQTFNPSIYHTHTHIEHRHGIYMNISIVL